MGNYIRTSFSEYLPLTGGTGGPFVFTGGTWANGSLSATTFYSGGTDLSQLISSAGSTGNFLPLTGGTGGSYTFTGGTWANGNLSATTIYSGSTDLSDLIPAATSPAGSTNQIQYNNAGAFAASSSLRYISSENRLIVGTPSTFTDVGEAMYVAGHIRATGAVSAATDVQIGRQAIFKGYSASLSSIGTNNIKCSNGSIQFLSVDASPVSLTYSDADIGTYIFVLTNSGVRTVTLAASSGWYTPEGAALNYNTSSGAVNVITAIYDGSKMLVTSTQNYIHKT